MLRKVRDTLGNLAAARERPATGAGIGLTDGAFAGPYGEPSCPNSAAGVRLGCRSGGTAAVPTLAATALSQ